ncbi:hypothetical protein X798_06652, partial [Onchocerca flexuosa]|uniref:Secreted protein n=2 Tax=Onchocerca flexuosa TaxID=387005 RepID=A0A183HXA2_9BILA
SFSIFFSFFIIWLWIHCYFTVRFFLCHCISFAFQSFPRPLLFPPIRVLLLIFFCDTRVAIALRQARVSLPHCMDVARWSRGGSVLAGLQAKGGLCGHVTCNIIA